MRRVTSRPVASKIERCTVLHRALRVIDVRYCTRTVLAVVLPHGELRCSVVHALHCTCRAIHCLFFGCATERYPPYAHNHSNNFVNQKKSQLPFAHFTQSYFYTFFFLLQNDDFSPQKPVQVGFALSQPLTKCQHSTIYIYIFCINHTIRIVGELTISGARPWG